MYDVQSYLDMIIYYFTWLLTNLLSIIFFPFKVYGRENIPKKGAFILACNHISNIDPPLMGITCPRVISYLAKDTLFKNKFLGWYLRQLKAFPINREKADIGAIKRILRNLQSGLPVVMFPEGTRKAEDRKKRAESGIGFIVAKSGVCVIPTLVKDTDQVMPVGAKFFHRHLVNVIFGPPITFPAGTDYDDIAISIMDHIEELNDNPGV